MFCIISEEYMKETLNLNKKKLLRFHGYEQIYGALALYYSLLYLEIHSTIVSKYLPFVLLKDFDMKS